MKKRPIILNEQEFDDVISAFCIGIGNLDQRSYADKRLSERLEGLKEKFEKTLETRSSRGKNTQKLWKKVR